MRMNERMRDDQFMLLMSVEEDKGELKEILPQPQNTTT